MDRRWAEICYFRLWLIKHIDEGADYTFFNEESFSWEKLETDFLCTRLSIVPLKRELCHGDRLDLKAVANHVGILWKQYCRLAACFLVFKNETKKKVITNARAIGIPMRDIPSRANPLRYLVIFLISIVVSIYIGVFISAAGWDLVTNGAPGALSQDPNRVTQWAVYGLANYGIAVLAVLLLSYLGWAFNHEQPSSYAASYACVFAIAMGVSTLSLACAVKLGDTPLAHKPFLEILYCEVKWTLSSALVSTYVARQVDRQIDSSLANSVPRQVRNRLWRRMLKCAGFGALVMFLSMQPALLLRAPPASDWPTDKLRVVVLGTVFMLGLGAAIVSEFVLRKSKPAVEPTPPESKVETVRTAHQTFSSEPELVD